MVGLGAVVAAACGSSSTAPTASFTNADLFNPARFNTSVIPWLAANQNATGTPTSGGTLKIEGSTDVSSFLDPQAEYETIGFGILRAISRQLVEYSNSSDFNKEVTLEADAATEIPTTANGGISADGLTYTFHLRSGLMWNTSPPRPVTSKDFLLGLKRECDPTIAPSANPGYYIATIKGYSDYCTPFEGMDPSSTAAQRAQYINSHDISGISTPDDSTIVFTLTSPASDFLNILALPFASAAPVETLNYVPGTPGTPLDYYAFSDGPYMVDPTKSNVGHEIVLTRNPNWSQTTDPIRHQYVDEVDIKVDLSSAAAETEVQQDITAGTADLSWDTVVPSEDLATLSSPHDPRFGSFPTPGTTNPYLVFNTMSTSNGGALGKVAVRQALEYAINKIAMNKIYGGTLFNEALNQVFSPGSEGYIAGYDPYATPGDQGDPAKCKSLLAAAGYPNGLTLTDIYRAGGKHPAVFQEVQTDFAKCGVTVNGEPNSSGYYGTKGIGISQPSDLAKPGEWDITEPGWVPDWFGPTNARAILPDLFDGKLSFPGTDWGGYDDPAVDNLVNQALAATTLSQATSLWQQANKKVMEDAAFVPFQTQLTNLMRSTRVHNAIFNPFSNSYDITQIWLSPTS
ncbi:MAG TPA: ABC transporter substrate-binding protein [Candidatus Binatia bacterium]|nr:ABC transporter substrate-binding protein [Candidatus Binatia bacterium]